MRAQGVQRELCAPIPAFGRDGRGRSVHSHPFWDIRLTGKQVT